MRYPSVLCGAALVLAVCSAAARGSGYDVTLDVSAGKQTQKAGTSSTRPADPPDPRPTLQAPAGSTFSAKWRVARTAKIEATDVLVHFYVVKLDRPGQAPPALDPDRVTIESALTMDFPPGGSAGATLPFHIDRAGVYLVRIQAGGNQAGQPGDHCDVELVVK